MATSIKFFSLTVLSHEYEICDAGNETRTHPYPVYKKELGKDTDKRLRIV